MSYSLASLQFTTRTDTSETQNTNREDKTDW